MRVEDSTPIIVGVGQITEPLAKDLVENSSPQELAARAAQCAIENTEVDIVAKHIDVLVSVRTTSDSTPMYRPPFGTPDNFPAAVARRVGITPAVSIYTKSGGNTPQQMVNEWCEKLSRGEGTVVLLTGAEATATCKAALRAGLELDWSESCGGVYENKGSGLRGMFGSEEAKHHLMSPLLQYSMAANMRRAQEKQTYEEMRKEIGDLFAPFSSIAQKNPHSMFPRAYSAKQIATPDEENPFICFPYTKHMVAKDGVNQGAAVLITTVGKARELGIAESLWVYLHAYAEAEDLPLIRRENVGRSVALSLSYQHALAQSGLTIAQIAYFDIYSCFPIVVSLVKEALNITDNNIPLTQTGGLPFFGGPGNNYSMHAISSVVEKLRKNPEDYALVGANGGMMNKHAVGIYSCRPGWKYCDSSDIQQQVLGQKRPQFQDFPSGKAIIESYTVAFQKNAPHSAVILGRTLPGNKRFLANAFSKDKEFLARLTEEDLVGTEIFVESFGKGNRAALSDVEMKLYSPKKVNKLRRHYEFCAVNVDDHILEVVIDRPEVYNALHPYANEELEEIFDVFMSDNSLWVAILTGAGEKAFSSGNDLKYSASGKPVWMPKTGFAGLTSRKGRNKPVIAAVNGVAMGGGMEIALACDIVIAASHAKFSLPEVKRGLIAAAGGVIRLSRQIPRKLAMEVLLTGKQISAQEALDFGFVNRVVPAEELMSSVRSLAKSLCENSPSAMSLTMDLMHEKQEILDPSIASGGHASVFDDLITSDDFYEGPKAFAEKRAPRWSS